MKIAKSLWNKWMALGLSTVMLASMAIGCSSSPQETAATSGAETTEETIAATSTASATDKTPEAIDKEKAETAAAAAAGEAVKVENKTGEKIRVGYDIYYLGNSWSVQLYQEFKWNAENMYKDDLEVTYVQSDNDVSKQIANLDVYAK